jgi:hypothetical protein
MEPAGGLGEAEALVTALLASDLFLELNGRLLLKGWAERNGDWIRESMTTQQRAVAGRRRAAGALRDASGRYLPSDQPAIGQLSTVTQISPAAVIENSPPR